MRLNGSRLSHRRSLIAAAAPSLPASHEPPLLWRILRLQLLWRLPVHRRVLMLRVRLQWLLRLSLNLRVILLLLGLVITPSVGRIRRWYRLLLLLVIARRRVLIVRVLLLGLWLEVLVVTREGVAWVCLLVTRSREVRQEKLLLLALGSVHLLKELLYK